MGDSNNTLNSFICVRLFDLVPDPDTIGESFTDKNNNR